MITNKEYKRNKRQNIKNLLGAIAFAIGTTISIGTIMQQCEAKAMEESELEKTIDKAYCYHKGILHHRSKDISGLYFCSLSEERCPFYTMDKNKEYCNATYKVKKKGF